MMDILQYPDPRLTQMAAELTGVTDAIRALVDNMKNAMYDARGVGLAAPQVGHAIRLVLVDVSGPDERKDFQVFINPRLSILDPSPVEDEEGCLSVPFNYRAPVCRSARVLVEALDMDWKPVRVEADGLLAVCLQHELDHLDGKLFLDHVSRLKRALFDTRVKKWQRRKQS